MVKRFFFYWVDILGNEFAVGMGIENTSFILPDAADAKSSIGDMTVMAAQETGDLIAFNFFIKHRFFEHGLSPR
jgi:hypothetical protein